VDSFHLTTGTIGLAFQISSVYSFSIFSATPALYALEDIGEASQRQPLTYNKSALEKENHV